jgi:circadian clock protein KaiC
MAESSQDRAGDVTEASLESRPPRHAARATTGIAGLDTILGGGLPRHHAYLVQGEHGSGKTTLALRFCISGAQQGERALYLSSCESEDDIRQVAASHGWALDGVTLHYDDARQHLGDEQRQSVFHPAEVELPRTIEALLAVIDRVNPERLVIDSMSEIRLLAADPGWFHRQLLTLKEDLVERQCTTLFCSDRPEPNQPELSIVHGAIDLEQLSLDYGPDRRRLRISKMRGQPFSSGYHDFRIRTGAIEVYPRLPAATERRGRIGAETVPSGLSALDSLFGGGADRATSTLLLGPSGTGKSSLATQFVMAAAARGERCDMYIFDEQTHTLLQRSMGLGLDLEAEVERGMVGLHPIDPAEMSPGEFSHRVRQANKAQNTQLLVIDSLAGYANAMPDERLLTVHLHEMLTYLNQQGVTVMLVMTQHGLPGAPRNTPFDLSYIADSVLLFQAFEFAGEIRRAISVYKRRGGPHEPTVRELQLGADGIRIGEPLRQFRGVLTGIPHFMGTTLPDIEEADAT